jgi:hypothetical protein
MQRPTDYYFSAIKPIYDKYWCYYQELIAKYPKSTTGEDDLRPSLLGMSGNAITAYLMAMALLETSLRDPQWWIRYTPYKSQNEIQKFLYEYDISIRQGYFILFLSRIEWGLRNLIAFLSPDTANGGLAEFKGIVDAILKLIDRQDLTDIFDIARHLRNSLHNSGRYFSKLGKDSPVYHYRGKEIQFHQGSLIETATELSFFLMDDLLDACKSIVDAPMVAAPNFIGFVLKELK